MLCTVFVLFDCYFSAFHCVFVVFDCSVSAILLLFVCTSVLCVVFFLSLFVRER